MVEVVGERASWWGRVGHVLRLVVGWAVVALGIAIALGPVDIEETSNCGWPAVRIAVDASPAPPEHRAECRSEAGAQSAGGAVFALAGVAVLMWRSRLRSRWEARVLCRAAERRVWRPSLLLRLCSFALAGIWAVWLVGALAGGQLLSGALGLLRIVPVLLFLLPPPWVRLAARPEGLEVVGIFRRHLMPWGDIAGVEATERGIVLHRLTGDSVTWHGVTTPSFLPRGRRKGYAEGIAEGVAAEVAARRGVTVEDLAAHSPR